MTKFRIHVPFAVMLAMAVVAGAGQGRLLSEETCGEYGTSVIFADSPAQAAKQAHNEEKLVFVLHVSGLFEDSDFT
jgi:hypothetical protein